MLVFLNMADECVDVYTDSGKESFFFDEMDQLKKQHGRSKATYITQTVDATIDQVIAVAEQAMLATEDSATLEADSGVRFVHSISKGILQFEIDGVPLVFNGPDDCKLIDHNMEAVIAGSFEIRSLIQDGRLEVIDVKQMRRITKKTNRERMKKNKLKDKKDKKELDSITVAPGVSAADAADNMFSGGGDDDDDAITLDLTNEVKGGGVGKPSEADIRSGRVEPGLLGSE